MSDSLTDQLLGQLSGAPLRQISAQLGVDPAQAASAVGTALPLLIGTLGRNASNPQGAQALYGALERDHAGGAGDLLGVLGSVLGGARTPQTDGAGILGHIFGGQQSGAQVALGKATGLGGDKAGQLMQMLAPIVLAFLAKQMFSGRAAAGGSTGVGSGIGQSVGSSGSGIDVLGSILGREHQRISQQGGLGGGLLGAVLDQDGDGKVDLGDLIKLGSSLFGGAR